MLYFAEKLSPHMALSAEGYLICRGVPVARSGTQSYLPSELGLGPDGGALIDVLRPEEEVFSPECAASFEGKPVTEDHPDVPEGVTAENIRFYQKGHAQNVRRGRGNQRHMLLADLVITDPATIRHIRAGKREISCGYTYTLTEENGRRIQRDIRGNHIAVVDRGRAGPRVRIQDRRPTDRKERSLKTMKPAAMKKPLTSPAGVFSRLVASALRGNDLEPEELPAVMNLMEAVAELAPAAEGAEAPAAAARTEFSPGPETPSEKPEEIPAAGADPEILSRLDRIIELLETLVPGGPAGADAEGDPEDILPEAEAVAAETERLQEAVAELLESAEADPALPPEADGRGDPEEDDPDRGGFLPASDRMVRAAVRAMKPVISRLPKAQQAAASDAALKAIKSLSREMRRSRGGYAALANAALSRDPADLGRQIIRSRNVNYRR